MKLIKSFLLIFILAVFAVTSRRNLKTHSRSKDEGNGSWASGYNCPGISYSLNGRFWYPPNKVFFEPTHLQKPYSETKKKGIYFTLKFNPENNPDKHIAKLLKYDPTEKKYYIPYNSIKSTLEYEKDTKTNYKSLAGWVKYNNGDLKFRIVLPYKSIGSYVSDDEVKKISELIKVRKAEFMATIKKTSRK